MPEAYDEPTPELIRELEQHNETYWQQQVALDSELKNLALDRHAVPVPNTNDPQRNMQYEPERMGANEGARTIDVMMGLFAHPATFSFQWTGDGTRGDQQRDQVITAMQEIWEALNPPGDKVYLREREQLFILGRCASLFLPGHEYWYDLPRRDEGQTETGYAKALRDWRRKAPVPILWRDLPAESTFPASLSRVDDEILSKIETTWWELLSIFSEDELADALPERKDRHQAATLCIYANRRWIAWAVEYRAPNQFGPVAIGTKREWKIVRTSEHKLGTCPIRIQAGKCGAWKEPGIYWRSVLYPVRRLLPQIDRRLSELATGNRLRVLPMLKAWLSDTTGEGAARVSKLLLGDIVTLDNSGGSEAREDIEPVYLPQADGQSMELVSFGMQLCRQLTGAVESLTGNYGPSDLPAWSKNFSAQVAVNYLAPWTQAVVERDKDALEMLMRCAEAFGEKIEITRRIGQGGSITLEPEDLTNWVPLITTEYKPRAPRDDRADLEIATQAMINWEQHPAVLLPPDYIAERYLEIEKPMEMLTRSETWRVLMSPEARQWRMKQLLDEMDIEIAQDESVPLDQAMQQYGGRIPPQMAALMQRKAGGMAGGAGAQGMSQMGRQDVNATGLGIQQPPFGANGMSVEEVGRAAR